MLVLVRGLLGGELPEDNAEREDVGLLIILLSLDDFGRHPLISAYLAGHFLCDKAAPAEVCDFGREVGVYQNIKTLEISVDNGDGKAMEVVHASSDTERNTKFLLPRELALLGTKETPERVIGTILKDNGELGRSFSAATVTHNDVGVAERDECLTL